MKYIDADKIRAEIERHNEAIMATMAGLVGYEVSSIIELK